MATITVNESTYNVTVDFDNQGEISILPAKGEKGDDGPANTLSIGTVTKGDNASATITGTAPSQTLNLVLPKGDKGDTGATGADGYSPQVTLTQVSATTASLSITSYDSTTQQTTTQTVTFGGTYTDGNGVSY